VGGPDGFVSEGQPLVQDNRKRDYSIYCVCDLFQQCGGCQLVGAWAWTGAENPALGRSLCCGDGRAGVVEFTTGRAKATTAYRRILLCVPEIPRHWHPNGQRDLCRGSGCR